MSARVRLPRTLVDILQLFGIFRRCGFAKATDALWAVFATSLSTVKLSSLMGMVSAASPIIADWQVLDKCSCAVPRINML